ncbi:hypothetical protein ACFRIC_09215 [Streptomyces sp. NPDC056738]|uniref:hypothetical protein n=1 Tax=Streptomyces sp. NPDC056738 TaxID=3345933 RepID=UPI0036806A0D
MNDPRPCALCGRECSPLYLCEWDARSLAKLLAELPALYAEAAQCLVPRNSGWGEIVATRGAAGPKSPIDEGVLDEMTDATTLRVMHSWRVDVQRVRWPQHTEPPLDTLAAICRWLATELEWIVAHYPAVGEMAREVRTLTNQARGTVGDPAPRPKVIGTCVAVTDDEGTVCGAELTHTAGQTSIRCRQCRTAYRSEQDLLLLLHYQAPAKPKPRLKDSDTAA